MAGTIMHLVVADQLLEPLKIQNPGLFYCGNLAPDAIMARDNYVRDMKRHTHFKDDIRLHELRQKDQFDIYLNRLLDFYQKYVIYNSSSHDLYLGYVVHILVDELYILHYRDAYVDQLISLGKNPDDSDFFEKFGHEVDLIDWELVKSYNFSYPMPDILYLEDFYEIKNYISYEELIKSKDFIIHKNFSTPHKKEPFQIMSLEQNLEFIDLCARKIPYILANRFQNKACHK